ncbi:MAG TPA: hypothetical protein VNO31_25405 [Umezawaea sp.]|nr:hypothetical protein [Umezawaea sp.]
MKRLALALAACTGLVSTATRDHAMASGGGEAEPASPPTTS